MVRLFSIQGAVKLCIIGMIVLHFYYMYSLISLNINGKCVSDAQDLVLYVKLFIGVILLLLIRMYEIYDIVAHNINQYNINITFRGIQVMFGLTGLISLKGLWNYFNYIDDRCLVLNEFIGIGLFPLFLVSIYVYYKFCVIIFYILASIILPKTIFLYFNNLLKNRSNNIKIYMGSIPECCVCYEENCWINNCGHLICKMCIPQLNPKNCPLCKANIDLIESYVNFKKNKKNN